MAPIWYMFYSKVQKTIPLMIMTVNPVRVLWTVMIAWTCSRLTRAPPWQSWNLIFLCLNQNICCGYSRESSWWDGSFEHTKCMLKMMDKQIFTIDSKILFISNESSFTTTSQTIDNPDNLVFLFLNQNISCGDSKEPSQWEGSFEHTKLMLKLMDKKLFLRSKFCLSPMAPIWSMFYRFRKSSHKW